MLSEFEALTGPWGTLWERGGPVVAILAVMSVLALTIVLIKLSQFARLRLWSRAWLAAVLAAARAGEFERALNLAAQSPSPVARALESALRGRTDPEQTDAGVREEVERVGVAELGALESNLRGLETIGTLAPLLGLLGTVMGMIRAFMRLEQAGGRVDPALLSGGIWEALLTTAVGLAVAIPTMAALSWFEGTIEGVRRDLGDAVTRVLNAGPGTRESPLPEQGRPSSDAPSGVRRAL